jgi:hypothetical protein
MKARFQELEKLLGKIMMSCSKVNHIGGLGYSFFVSKNAKNKVVRW